MIDINIIKPYLMVILYLVTFIANFLIILNYFNIHLYIDKSKKSQKSKKSLFNKITEKSSWKRSPFFLCLLFGCAIIYSVGKGTIYYSTGDYNMSNVIGSYTTCRGQYCYWEVQEGNDIYFLFNLKYDSTNIVKIEYLSDYDQNINIGFGDGIIGYKIFETGLEKTINTSRVSYKVVDDSYLCEKCFTTFFQKLDPISNIKYYLKISPQKNLKIISASVLTISHFNLYRLSISFIGLIYLIMGIFGLWKYK